MKVQIKGGELDLAAALPLTIGDSRRLKKEFGVGPEQINSGDPDATASVLLVLFQKVQPDITIADVDTLSLQTAAEIGAYLRNEAESVDRPT